MKKILMLILIGLLMSTVPVYAFQQTIGELTSNVSIGNSSIMKYGIKNDENVSITVKFSIVGTIFEYMDYPKELRLEPDQFAYVQLKTSIPADYSGGNKISGVIYALKEGEKNGQVQVNTQLAKKITVNVLGSENKVKTIPAIGGLMFITVALFVAMVLINRKKVKPI